MRSTARCSKEAQFTAWWIVFCRAVEREVLRRAYKEQPAPEPVAWRYKTNLPGARWEVSTMSPAEARAWNVIVEEQPLYAHPPQSEPCTRATCRIGQRKPLTDAEIWQTYKNLWLFHPSDEPRLAGDVLKFARAIERAHGIGGEK